MAEEMIARTVGGQPIVVEEDVLASFTEAQRSRFANMLQGMVPSDRDMRKSVPVALSEAFHAYVGYAKCVATTASDEVFYANVGRRGTVWARFVRGRKPELTRAQTVVLRPIPGMGWRVVAAYLGGQTAHFPGDPFAREAVSKRFWACHALVDGAMPYDPASATTICPW